MRDNIRVDPRKDDDMSKRLEIDYRKILQKGLIFATNRLLNGAGQSHRHHHRLTSVTQHHSTSMTH